MAFIKLPSTFSVLSVSAGLMLAATASAQDVIFDNQAQIQFYEPRPYCHEVAFTVSGSAENYDLSHYNQSSPAFVESAVYDIVYGWYTTTPVNGTDTIAGYYCEPAVKNENSTKLQLMFHSITANRDYWSAMGGTTLGYDSYKPEIYSWRHYANALGYPTLQIDRLGHGRSSHPDPVAVNQGPYEASLYNDLVNQIRSGDTDQVPQYDEMIYVGNSYGSELGVYIAATYPDLFNMSIFTGYTKRVLPAYAGILLQDPQPASVVFPERFSNVTSPFYLTSHDEPTRTNTFFGAHDEVDFEQELAQIWWEREDVVAVGEFLGAFVLLTRAPAYTGRVLVITGEQDQPFCGLGSPILGVAACGDLLPRTGEMFPNAEWNWKRIARTGHAVNLFRSAPETFRVAHDFMAGARFDG